jgi:uncharacterized membrane protein YdjX (TVP38/TMEM64 family)
MDLLGWGLIAVTADLTSLMNPSLTMDHVRLIITRWGLWAPAASILLMVAHTFVPFPADLLIVANGAVFGFWGGLLVSVSGAVSSACLAFAIARVLGRPAALRFVPAAALEWVDRIVAQGGSAVVLLLQILPLLPFSLLNFAFGLTPLPWTTFLWTTAVGVLPTNIVLVAVGYGVAGVRVVLPWSLAILVVLTAIIAALRFRVAQALQVPWLLSRGLPPSKRTMSAKGMNEVSRRLARPKVR